MNIHIALSGAPINLECSPKHIAECLPDDLSELVVIACSDPSTHAQKLNGYRARHGFPVEGASS